MEASETTQRVPLPSATARLQLLKGGRHTSGDTGSIPKLPHNPTPGIDGARPIVKLVSPRDTRRAKETVARGWATAREVERRIIDAFHVEVARFGGALAGDPVLAYDDAREQLMIQARVYPPAAAAAVEAHTELEPTAYTPPSGIDLPQRPPPGRARHWPAPKRPLPRWVTRVQVTAVALTFALLALAASRWGVPLRRLPHALWFAAFATYALGPAVALRRHLSRPRRGERSKHRQA